ncbi:hypothetical protein ED5_2136 [Enterobacter roggenkampii]|nr:hypothetical protein ED5_2136 [Enterobacter roggenkampii]
MFPVHTAVPPGRKDGQYRIVNLTAGYLLADSPTRAFM